MGGISPECHILTLFEEMKRMNEWNKVNDLKYQV
jgi:hypothetical protein